MVATGYLTSILERKRAELRESPPTVVRTDGHGRPFTATLRRRDGVAVIAEVKRRSPMKGPLAPSADAAALCLLYERGGAAACSVLTDSGFDGSLDDLRVARNACTLPLLRKDFLLAPRQGAEARAAGADAVLLIAAALPGVALEEMMAAAVEAGVEALVEVHDGVELDRALEAGATLVGVNNRDLETFEVHLETSLSLGPRVPDGVISVSESGITSGADARKLREAGFDAVLVGEALVRSDDPAALVREIAACG